MSAARSVGSNDACRRPASIRAKSSNELTSLSSLSELRCTRSSFFADVLGQAIVGDRLLHWTQHERERPCGTRDSRWKRKVVFARSISASASARSRCASNACASAIAVVICRATRSRNDRYASSRGRRTLVPTTSTPVRWLGPALFNGRSTACWAGSDQGLAGIEIPRRGRLSIFRRTCLCNSSSSGEGEIGARKAVRSRHRRPVPSCGATHCHRGSLSSSR